jgi:hypothetical protein
MIASDQIERWALAGKCIWRTFNTGYTSTATIPVPAGSFILLRQIIIYPFIPYFRSPGNVSESVWQLVTAEQGNSNELVYVIRNSRLPAGVGVASNDHPNTPQTIETWATYRKNVVVDLSLLPNSARATYAPVDVLNVSADERDNKLGYGGVPVIPSVQLDAFDNLYPTGEQRPFNATAYAGAAIMDRIRIKNQGAYQIPAVNAADAVHADFQFPLITFGYWEFKAATPEQLV